MRDRASLLPYVSFVLDDANALRPISALLPNARLVGWQCGFEPLVVAVQSYLGDADGNPDRVSDDEAIEIATDFLLERRWFSDESDTDPDFII